MTIELGLDDEESEELDEPILIEEAPPVTPVEVQVSSQMSQEDAGVDPEFTIPIGLDDQDDELVDQYDELVDGMVISAEVEPDSSSSASNLPDSTEVTIQIGLEDQENQEEDSEGSLLLETSDDELGEGLVIEPEQIHEEPQTVNVKLSETIQEAPSLNTPETTIQLGLDDDDSDDDDELAPDLLISPESLLAEDAEQAISKTESGLEIKAVAEDTAPTTITNPTPGVLPEVNYSAGRN